MEETPEDIQRLQALLDESIEQAGSFLRSSFQMPEHSLSATQLVDYFEGVHTVALATVTAQSEPRVAPIGTFFFRGSFYIPTVASAARAKHINRQPAISLTHFVGNDLAIIVHGKATILSPEDADFEKLEQVYYASAGQKVQDWGEGIYLRVESHKIYTYARDMTQY